MIENLQTFISEFAKSLQADTFVKLTLGNYKGSDEHLQKILLRLVKTKRGNRIFFLYRFDTRDMAKNFSFAEGLKLLGNLLGKDFFAGHLFTTENDFQLEIGRKNRSRLNIAKPTFKTKPNLSHDREKTRFVRQDSFYLQALGVTTDTGQIREKQQDKWKQINKFVETLAGLFANSRLRDRGKLKIVDMGSGKGYLTFAAYDYFKNIRELEVTVVGVDTKTEMVGLCNDIAKSCEFENLHFVQGTICDFDLPEADILIALHACNTATDEAIFKGIIADAEIIIAAPCCHQEIRPQIKSPDFLDGVLRHGVMLERTAETITDGLRSLFLEKSGYATKIFEFIPTEHTPKNTMLVGVRSDEKVDLNRIESQIERIKEFYGIETHRLEALLNRALPFAE